MKPVSDSSSQPLHNTSDAMTTRASAQKKVQGYSSESSTTSAIDAKNILFETAISAVKRNDNIVDGEKVESLKQRIENGQYEALSREAGEFWDNLANKIVETENGYNK